MIDVAERQGWQVTLKKSGHLRFKPPSKKRKLVFSGSTPSDHRSVKNLRQQLRRQGLRI